MIVYKIVNTINDKVYIGISSKDSKTRFSWHIRDCKRGVRKKLYSAMRELGVENFLIEVLEHCQNKEEIKLKEEYYIKFYNCYENGYNASPKSGGVKHHSLETKQKMSAKAQGRIIPEEGKKKRSDALKKFWQTKSEEEMRQFADSIKGRNLGRKMSETFKKNCSERMKGVKLSEDTKAKMSASRKGRILAKVEEMTCPHCNSKGKSNAMFRWHFDNCKEKT